VSGTTWIGGVFQAILPGSAVSVFISPTGQLGTLPSSRRFKKEIKAMDKASESILALKPVTFHYKSDKANTPQFGLIAEEVAEVNPDLIVRDKKGDIYSVRYEAVNAMLLNEFLKEHRKVEMLESRLTDEQKAIALLKMQLERVSARIDAASSTTTVALHRP
jgi:hypothetical protein